MFHIILFKLYVNTQFERSPIIWSLNKNLKKLHYCYRAAAVGESNATEEEIYQVIELVNEAPHLTAIGLFEVNRSTLTAIFGQVLTYLIICIQFAMTAPPPPTNF